MGKLYGFKVKNDAKLRGAYGETDFDKKTIRINKAKHKKKGVKRITPNKDGSENMAMTILHEAMHAKHPKKGEKAVENLARAMKSRMSPKQKKRLYSKVP